MTPEQRLISILFSVLVLLNIADYFLTVQIIQLGGAEANPIMVYVMERFGGITGIIIAKSIPLIVLGLTLEYLYTTSNPKHNRIKRLLPLTLIFINIGLFIVCLLSTFVVLTT